MVCMNGVELGESMEDGEKQRGKEDVIKDGEKNCGGGEEDVAKEDPWRKQNMSNKIQLKKHNFNNNKYNNK